MLNEPTPPPPERPDGPDEPRFLDQVANACRVQHLAYRTEPSCVSWVERLIRFHNKRNLRDVRPVEVRAFLAHLAVHRTVSAPTQNQALNAIVFMSREVVRRDPAEVGELDRAKRPKRLPTVLTRDEGKCVLVHMEGTHGRMVSWLYGTGMRLMECVASQLAVILTAGGSSRLAFSFLKNLPALFYESDVGREITR